MAVELMVKFQSTDLNDLSDEIFRAIEGYEDMLSVLESCGEMALNTACVLRPLLSIQKTILNEFKTRQAGPYEGNGLMYRTQTHNRGLRQPQTHGPHVSPEAC
ncbi:MAG: hypothetical protein HQL84_08245 [Magnetococcales bacterium]|nr:hypothetical protein [Magnetococcales bacterium]MBF0150020.1 hypothetical protein [Magnetococcales bacterium]MBF0629534.1 hypothetical protein [Magnetococcales bacterium]